MSSKQERPYLDFYRQYKISPVTQDISDFNKHCDRREFLYRRLGIPASFVQGRTVIEFGPGSGHNSIYTYSLGPAQYVMVDGNDIGLQECKKLFAKYFPEHDCEFVKSLIEEYKTDHLFDLVLCEGLIPAQKNPADFCRHVGGFTAPGGVYFITCHDVISHFSELLRSLIGCLFITEEMAFEKKIEVLLKIFSSHLVHLRGMSRSHQDWAIDNIIHKSLWQESKMFSIHDAIEAMEDSFDVYGSSPFFMIDWRWYKDVHGEQKNFNQIGKESYWRNLHNFFDYRETLAPREIEANKKLYAICMEIWKLIAAFGRERDARYIPQVHDLLLKAEKNVREFSELTADSIADFCKTLKQYPKITPETRWGRFEPWWGRGMQYLSFIRNR